MHDTVLNDVHTCTSRSRKKTTTPSCKWVASKVVSILRIKILRWVLRSCRISYKMITIAQLVMTQFGEEKRRALDQLYETWK
jgi:hypothetical protein